MQGRSYSPLDRLLGEFDKIIKILYAPARPGRPSPAGPGGELGLNEAERLESTRLMRVNHSGEIAAQALYQGQGLTARDPAVAAVMRPTSTPAVPRARNGPSGEKVVPLSDSMPMMPMGLAPRTGDRLSSPDVVL